MAGSGNFLSILGCSLFFYLSDLGLVGGGQGRTEYGVVVLQSTECYALRIPAYACRCGVVCRSSIDDDPRSIVYAVVLLPTGEGKEGMERETIDTPNFP